MITRNPGVRALAALLLIAVPLGGAEAKREVNLDCKWFGTAPFCKGRCPAG